MDSSFVARNDQERQRLHQLVGRLSEAELATPLDAEWVVGVALAHLAFWDRCAMVLLESWEQRGFHPAEWFDSLEINDAALPGWRLIPARDVLREVLAAADDADARAARAIQLPQHLIDAIQGGGRWDLLDRSVHRKEHLDQIERALAKPES